MPAKIPIDENKLRYLHAQDMTTAQIAQQLGLRPSTLEKRLKKLGLRKARSGPKTGRRHPAYKGWTIRKGYRYLYRPDHPHAINGRYVAEHRLVMEQQLGRYLERHEVVHHIDENRLNNAPENLQLFSTNAEHLKYELTGCKPNWTAEGWAKMCSPRKKTASR